MKILFCNALRNRRVSIGGDSVFFGRTGRSEDLAKKPHLFNLLLRAHPGMTVIRDEPFLDTDQVSQSDCVVVDVLIEDLASNTIPEVASEVPESVEEVAPEVVPEVIPEVVLEVAPEVVPEIIDAKPLNIGSIPVPDPSQKKSKVRQGLKKKHQ